MRSPSRLIVIAASAVLAAACSAAPASTPSPAATGSGSASSGSPVGQDVCSHPVAAPGTTLTFASVGGAYQKAQEQAWLQPYSELTGVQWVEATDGSGVKVKAMVEAGQVTWDVVLVDSTFGFPSDKDLLEPIDYSLVRQSEIQPGFMEPYRVGSVITSAVLAYRTDKVGAQPPQGWADFFDLQKYPGKRGVRDLSTGGVMEIALLADGVAPKDLYPIDIPRALKKLDTIKDQIVFWSSGAQSQELIDSGEVALSIMYNGRAWASKNTDKAAVAIQWNGQLLNGDFWVVPKGAPHKDAAMQFIAWATCAENDGAISKYIPYGPVNINSKPDPANAADLPTSNINDSSAYANFQWRETNKQALTEAYNSWKTK